MKKILVCGAGGFIGNHLVNFLKLDKNNYVIGVDLKLPKYNISQADEFYIIDLRNQQQIHKLYEYRFHEIYQLAADMGGAGYVFTGTNDANIMHNSMQINLNILKLMVDKKIPKVFYSSSACMYPEINQIDPNNPNCVENSAYPAQPDSEYGWEKLFSERLYLNFAKNYKLDVRIARFHNIFGPKGSWNNGKEKAPAALCRKVIQSNGIVEVWGTGEQTRSFLFIDECIEGIYKIMQSSYTKPINLGSTRKISINELVKLIAKINNKSITLKHIEGPIGVMGRVSDNNLIQEVTGWVPKENLEYGLQQTYNWILEQINHNQSDHE